MAANSPEGQNSLEEWRSATGSRKQLLWKELIDTGIFPSEQEADWEEEGGLYPGIEDPDFVSKLMRKREFQESKQPSIKESLADGKDRCNRDVEFELSSVQRFVSRFLSPRTPFRSALLYHGVGVGKTCAAVTICENYLEENPGRKAFVIAPPNIQEGFKRTIFDKERIIIPEGDEDNTHNECTGNTYLKLTGSLREKNKGTIEKRAVRMMNSRYEFFGYYSFYNYIISKLKSLESLRGRIDDEQLEEKKREILRREFSDRVLIIDEAHNLRDNPFEAEEESADDASVDDTNLSKAGKKLTPFLKEVLSVAENITLVLLTATPMYNSYIEIIFLLNLLLLNDKRAILNPNDIFDLKTESFREGGRELLGSIASSYISFMRGENPLTFPLRLEPLEGRLKGWAIQTPKGERITAGEREKCMKLPCISARFSLETEKEYKAYCKELATSKEGLRIENRDQLIQAGNWLLPIQEEIQFRKGEEAFQQAFTKEKRGNTIYYRANEDIGAAWLLEDGLENYSGKCKVLLHRLSKCKGVGFVYSRFVTMGGLMICLALEANGYLPYGRDSGLLVDGNQHPDGMQCAKCEQKERFHREIKDHEFTQARYVLLTGSEELSPNNAASVRATRRISNKDGSEIKVIVGSQIAGEGIDLKYIREVFVYDSWYHLNKLEQIVGRGIRTCSHADLPEEQRNCTISLLVNTYATEPMTETIDMYSYRLALNKARTVGNVTRVLKEFALDCAINKDAIVVQGLDPIPVLYDSQGERRENVNRNDIPLSPLCDWLETCDYECHIGRGDSFMIDEDDLDYSTYDEYTARFQLTKIKNYIKDLVSKEQVFINFEDIAKQFTSIPRPLLTSLLIDLLEGRDFTVGEGRMIYKNGYFVYQPNKIKDESIPIAIRLAHLPLPRDRYEAKEIKPIEKVKRSVEYDSEELWKEVLIYAEAIENGTASTTKYPVRVMKEISKLPESAGIIKTQEERLDMIRWIYENIRENSEARKIFAQCVREYFWDEYITTGTKREFLITSHENENIKILARDSYWIYQGQLFLRLLNKDTYSIEYYIVDPKTKLITPAPAGLIARLERDDAQREDPITKKPLDGRSTGFLYGFIVKNLKKNTFMFKKGKPPMPGGKVGRGGECSSGTEFERNQLLVLGTALQKEGKSDLGLNEETMLRKRIQNSVRVCTVNDLALRFMDKVNLQKKRWFYRPLEAKLYKHPLR
jgi:hypothetical protein